MLFNSMAFFFFFPIVTLGYFLLPHKVRWIWLLAASSYFYMAFVPKYILILGGTIVLDYFGGRLLENRHRKGRKVYFGTLIALNVSVLVFFKYYNFLLTSFQSLLVEAHIAYPLPFLDIILPIGLSFHTFQAMSYLIEIYRGEQKPERHFGVYALFVMFYPQLVAGPIERPQNLLHQFHEEHHFSSSRCSLGARKMLWGFFKKMVVADRLGLYVDAIYNNPQHHNSASLGLATIFLAFQIYADFSGYSDIAIGAAQIMGFDLMINFRRPYFARNFTEFWGRWHISLSTWFRDYVYFPLGGSRMGPWNKARNVMIVFVLSGLWHGANWTFCIWGAIHGLFRVVEDLPSQIFGASRDQKYLPDWVQRLVVFSFACIAWVFFRARTFQDALYIFRRMVSGVSGLPFHGSPEVLVYPLIGLALLFLSDLRDEFFPRRFPVFHHPHWLVRRLGYTAVISLILLIGVLEGGQFIYFQF